ncbi:Pyruvate/Phosphoenolpyruvate kinase-like domain-containing protein [Syncephalis plumigaleata]|nr:Pyruvate/Phosphoenolpyruvate kinase-like domain-containing protein [Syncephalis plumigaleata]
MLRSLSLRHIRPAQCLHLRMGGSRWVSQTSPESKQLRSSDDNNTSTLAKGLTMDRSRRALFYVPGSDQRKLKSATKLEADCIVYDLEDSVPFARKGAARSMVFDALEASGDRVQEISVRINAVDSGLAVDDLNVTLLSKHLQAIVIPKVHQASDVHFISRMIDSVAPVDRREHIRLIASIESARGIMNIKEIAKSDPRLSALLFAAEDYCADLGLIRTSHRREMLYARSALVTTACAYGLQSIDLVCMDYQDDAILRSECQEGREMGFTGKQAIHPRQIATIQDMFRPSDEDLIRAVKIVKGYEEHSQRGYGAFGLEGKVFVSF